MSKSRLLFPGRITPRSPVARHGPFAPGLVTSRRWINGIQGPQTDPNPDPTPDDGSKQEEKEKKGTDWKGTGFKMFESAATTFASISILGLVGYSYNIYYKYHVLNKMENAFAPGDPVLEITGHGMKAMPATDAHDEADDEERDHWILRHEQETIDRIISGKDRGSYHL